MRNSIKRCSKQRHSSLSHAHHDLDAAAMRLADIGITIDDSQTDDNQVTIVPIKLAHEDPVDFDRLAVEPSFDFRFASEPRPSESFALVEDIQSEGRIQPVMDFPQNPSSDSPKPGDNQPGIDDPYGLNHVFQTKEHFSAERHGIGNGESGVVGERPLTVQAGLEPPIAHEKPVEIKVENLSASKWPQADKKTRANPRLSRLIALLIGALIACTGILGYMMLEITTELKQLNGQLDHFLTNKTGD